MEKNDEIKQLTATLATMVAQNEQRHRTMMRYVVSLMVGIFVLVGTVVFERAEFIPQAHAGIIKDLEKDEKLVREVLTKMNVLLGGTIKVMEKDGPQIAETAKAVSDLVIKMDALVQNDQYITALAVEELKLLNHTMRVMGYSMGSTMGRMGQWMP